MNVESRLKVEYPDGKITLCEFGLGELPLEEAIICTGKHPAGTKVYYLPIGSSEFVLFDDANAKTKIDAFWEDESVKERANPSKVKLDGDHYLKKWRTANPKQGKIN